MSRTLPEKSIQSGYGVGRAAAGLSRDGRKVRAPQGGTPGNTREE